MACIIHHIVVAYIPHDDVVIVVAVHHANIETMNLQFNVKCSHRFKHGTLMVNTLMVNSTYYLNIGHSQNNMLSYVEDD